MKWQIKLETQFYRPVHAKVSISVLAEDPGVINALSAQQTKSNQPNQRLERYANVAGLEAIYLMDSEGLTQASSNYQNQPSLSFMNKNYGFRPYFTASIKGNGGAYFAVGATTGLPGHFISSPVLDSLGNVIGVLAAKIDAAILSVIWQSTEDLGFITNNSGVIIMSSKSAWLYQTIAPLTALQINTIRLQKQFSGKLLPAFSWHPVDDLLDLPFHMEKSVL